VRALNLRSGRLLWIYDAQQPVVASPVTGDGIVFIAGSSGRCHALDIRTGKLLWSNGSIDGFVETIPLIYKGMLIFGTWNNRLYALDTETGKTRWIWFNGYSNRMLSPAACVPVAVRDRFCRAPGQEDACLDASSGRLICQSDLGGASQESMGCRPNSSMVLARHERGSIGVSTSERSRDTLAYRLQYRI
jgi:outer membrane protein assembly factor BamB